MNATKVTAYAEWENYSGVLYGESSMVIYKDGVEILHTGSRNSVIRTKDDLMEYLKEMPKFMEMLDKHWEEMMKDNDDVDEI